MTMAELCPEEREVLAAIRAEGGYISPSRLHRAYLKVTANADVDYDFGELVLAITRGTSGSRRADPQGDRIARRLSAA